MSSRPHISRDPDSEGYFIVPFHHVADTRWCRSAEDARSRAQEGLREHHYWEAVAAEIDRQATPSGFTADQVDAITRALTALRDATQALRDAGVLE